MLGHTSFTIFGRWSFLNNSSAIASPPVIVISSRDGFSSILRIPLLDLSLRLEIRSVNSETDLCFSVVLEIRIAEQPGAAAAAGWR